MAASNRKRALHRALWLLAPLAFLVLSFAVPLLVTILFALGVEGADATRVLREILASAYHRQRIAFTFLQALLSTLLVLAAGLPLAYLFATRDFPAKRFLRAAITVPFVMPPLVVALGLQAFVGRGSLLDDALGWDLLAALGPLGSILLAHLVYNVSLVTRLVGAYWERIPPAYADAARTLGAGPRAALTRVLLPLARPAIASAALLAFLFSTTSFGIILLLGGGQAGTLETLIYEEVASFRPHYEVATVLGVIQLATTTITIVAYLWLQRHGSHRFAPSTTAPKRRLGPIGIFGLALGVFITAGPFVALAFDAFRYAGSPSLQPIRFVLANQPALGSYTTGQALLTSLAFAFGTALVALPLALATAYAFRGTPGLAWWGQGLLLLPLGTSAVLVALGTVLTYDGSPLWDLRAHPGRIMLVHILVAFPFVSRILGPGLDALHPSLDAAARTLGARARQVVWRIDLPLLRPALAASAIFAFAVSLGEFGATLMLRRPEFTTLPLAIYDAYGRPGAAFRAQAEVLSLALVLVALLAFWLLERFRVGTRSEFA